MEVDNKEIFEQIESVLREHIVIEEKLYSITKKLNANEQQLKESSNFLLSTSKLLFAKKSELLKEKKFTDDLFEIASVIIVIFDTAGNIVRFNSFAEKLIGYEEEEVVGINWVDNFMVEEDKEEMRKNFFEVLKPDSECNNIENKIICKDGTIKKIDWTCTIIHGNEPDNAYVLGIGIDITKRKEIESTLKKERKLFSVGPVAIMTWLPKSGWPIKYASTNIYKILGYTVEELTSSSFKFTSLMHADDIERISNEVFYNKENNIDVFEQSYRLKHKDGHYIWFYDFTNFIRDKHNNLIEIRGYVFDQTILKQSEIERESQKQRLDHIVKSTKLGTWEWNVITDEFIINEQWANIIGYTLEELSPINTKIWSKHIHPDDFIISNKLLDKHISGELDYYSFQCRMKHKDGHWVWIHDKGKIYTWSKDGKSEWMFGTHQDISESKNAEKNLKIAMGKAEESDRLKSAFIANISHEIRTPLNSILGVVNLISDNLVTAEELEEYKGFMEISSTRLTNTINDIVEIAHIASDQATITPSKFNLNTLIDEIFAEGNDLAGIKNLKMELSYDVHYDEAFMFCDYDKLKTILSNFLNNAFKFTESGSIKIGYRILKNMQQPKVEFFIEDTGIGIPHNKQKKIFDSFMQADVGYTRKYEGFGLGLAINKAYIEMMEGEVSLVSKEGEGTKFIFTIPYKKANQKD